MKSGVVPFGSATSCNYRINPNGQPVPSQYLEKKRGSYALHVTPSLKRWWAGEDSNL
jgi:hypothetical protein